mmetsp:Transcript_17948/g.50214  ORF Transcript_17948/g.50214 Transcript_17948/m.50214 type:complete len:451 (+) Transcript_17948:1095-2447(+)
MGGRPLGTLQVRHRSLPQLPMADGQPLETALHPLLPPPTPQMADGLPSAAVLETQLQPLPPPSTRPIQAGRSYPATCSPSLSNLPVGTGAGCRGTGPQLAGMAVLACRAMAPLQAPGCLIMELRLAGAHPTAGRHPSEELQVPCLPTAEPPEEECLRTALQRVACIPMEGLPLVRLLGCQPTAALGLLRAAPLTLLLPAEALGAAGGTLLEARLAAPLQWGRCPALACSWFPPLAGTPSPSFPRIPRPKHRRPKHRHPTPSMTSSQPLARLFRLPPQPRGLLLSSSPRLPMYSVARRPHPQPPRPTPLHPLSEPLLVLSEPLLAVLAEPLLAACSSLQIPSQPSVATPQPPKPATLLSPQTRLPPLEAWLPQLPPSPTVLPMERPHSSLMPALAHLELHRLVSMGRCQAQACSQPAALGSFPLLPLEPSKCRLRAGIHLRSPAETASTLF